VINLVGAHNAGKLGTNEGGNVLIAKMFGVMDGAGSTLALCLRARGSLDRSRAVSMVVMKRADWTKQNGGEGP
jgi:hypothetical protein